VKQVK